MGCLGWLFGWIMVRVFILRGFSRAIWVGIAVGAIVGLIIALVKWDGFQILYGCGWGLLGGLVFELIIRLINKIDSRRNR